MKNQSKERILISGFIPPDQLDERALIEYKECGFNICFMTENYYKVDSPEYFESLKLMEKLGLDACVTFYKGQTGKYHEHFKNVDLHDYPAVKYIHFIDEPDDDLIKKVSDIYVPWYNEKYSDLGFFMNTYGSCPKGKEKTYEEHLDKCAQEINAKVKGNNKIFSVDSYPLRYAPGYWVKRLNAKPYFHGLVLASQRAKRTGSKLGGCIQAFEGFVDCRYPNCVADLRFQVFCQLAFGAKSLCYFVYKTEETTNYAFRGMITMKVPREDMSNRRTELYYFTRKTNAEIATFDEEYMTYDWKGTTFVDGRLKNDYAEEFKHAREDFGMNYTDDNIVDAKSDGDVLIGCFEKDGGKKAYVLANFTEPGTESETRVWITFKKGQSVRINHNGVWMKDTLKDGKFYLTINNGDGVFIVLE
jgi:hypothetical protein